MAMFGGQPVQRLPAPGQAPTGSAPRTPMPRPQQPPAPGMTVTPGGAGGGAPGTTPGGMPGAQPPVQPPIQPQPAQQAPPPPPAPNPNTPPDQNAMAMQWLQQHMPSWYHPTAGPTSGGGMWRPAQQQSPAQHTQADLSAYIQQNPTSPLARQFARAGFSYGPGGNAHYNAGFATNPNAWWNRPAQPPTQPPPQPPGGG